MHRQGFHIIRLTTLVVVLCMFHLTSAQNIVPNGGFEEIELCPSGNSQIFRSPPWQSSSNSPDLYSTCGLGGFHNPENVNGWQSSNTDSSYAGIATYSENWHGLNTREFLKCTLNYSLIANEGYYVEFHVSQADSLQFATHNLGVTFTDVDTGDFGELLCWPNCDVYVENTSANPLSSKTDWMKVSGTFTAHGGEQYIHIGNFRTDDNSEIEFIGGGTDPNVVWNQAYYYIDDVWLSHVDSMHYVSVNDQLEIKNDELSLYPNPNMGVFNIDLEGMNGAPAELLLYDLTGKQVAHRWLDHTYNTIQLEAADGLYLYTVTVNGTLKWSGKIAVATD